MRPRWQSLWLTVSGSPPQGRREQTDCAVRFCALARLRDLAAHFRASFAFEPSAPRSEGAGNAGRSMRPQPCVRNKKAHKHSHHGHTGFTRHSPRNGFNGFLRTLPGDRAFLPPSPAEDSANLTPASGRQDHTTSPSASGAFVTSASASTASRRPRP